MPKGVRVWYRAERMSLGRKELHEERVGSLNDQVVRETLNLKWKLLV